MYIRWSMNLGMWSNFPGNIVVWLYLRRRLVCMFHNIGVYESGCIFCNLRCALDIYIVLSNLSETTSKIGQRTSSLTTILQSLAGFALIIIP